MCASSETCLFLLLVVRGSLLTGCVFGRALLEEQARQRSAAASSEAAIAMARGSRPQAPLKPRASAIKAELPGPEVRVAQAKLAEGVASPEEEKMVEDWHRRSSAVAAGRRRVEADKQRPERRVGVKVRERREKEEIDADTKMAAKGAHVCHGHGPVL